MWVLPVAVILLFIGKSTQHMLEKRAAEDGKRVVCYYASWSVEKEAPFKLMAENIDPFLCTHLIYAFAIVDIENITLAGLYPLHDVNENGFFNFTNLKSQNPALKLMVSVGGWNEGTSKFSKLSADASLRPKFAYNAITFLRHYSFDGLDLDWLFPGFRDGCRVEDKENYALLIKELREDFEEESTRTGNPRLILSVVIPSLPVYLEKGYDIPTLNRYSDFMTMGGYDYHQSPGPIVHHHASLYPLKQDIDDPINSKLNVDASIRHLLSKGVRPELLNLGIPTYGRFYKLEDPNQNTPGSSSAGQGRGNSSNEPGFRAYYEICADLLKNWTVVKINSTAMGPYAYRDSEWVSYDDMEIIKVKVAYVKSKQIGGLMFWSIDQDDFSGRCHGVRFPLIRAGRDAFLEHSAPTTKIWNIPSTTPSGTTHFSSHSPGGIPLSSPYFTKPITPLKEVSLISVLFPENSVFHNIKIWITNNYYGIPESAVRN